MRGTGLGAQHFETLHLTFSLCIPIYPHNPFVRVERENEEINLQVIYRTTKFKKVFNEKL